MSTPISSLDPRVGVERPSNNMIRMLFEGLMSRGPKGELVHGLAERVEISEDKKMYTFYLRPSYWSNGTLLTARDFEYAWKHSIDPRSAQLGAFHFSPIKNATLCLEGKVPVHEVGISAADDLVLSVELEHPCPYFLELTACTTYAPIPQFLMQKENQASRFIEPTLVGNGPFLLKEWKKGKTLVLEKNPLYWNAGVVSIPGVFVRIVPESSVRHLMFDQKKFDWMGEPLSPLSYDAIEEVCSENRLETSNVYGLNWIFINTETPPYNNKKFRKALNLAIDRSLIIKHLMPETRLPACRIFNPCKFGESSNCFDDGNQEFAHLYFNSALSELQIKKEDLPELSLSYDVSNDHQTKIAYLIREQWESLLGIKVNLDPVEKSRLFSQMVKGNYQVSVVFWVSLIEDPIYMLDIFRSENKNVNISRWVNREYKNLLVQIDLESDQERRKELLLRAEEFLMEETPIIPICFGTALYMKNEKLENVSVSPLMEIDFKYATFVDK